VHNRAPFYAIIQSRASVRTTRSDMTQTRRPNLLILMTDQQQATTVDLGNPCQTPNIDRISAGGVRFTRAHTVNAICSPARASLYTGLLPHTHGMVDCTHTVEEYRARFKAELPMWSRSLQQAGYATAHYGKWHVERSNQLEHFGFGEYEHPGSPAFHAYRAEMGLPLRPESFSMSYTVRHPGYNDLRLYGVLDEPEEASKPYYLYSKGIDFVRRCAQDGDQPWCLVVSTQEPHDPYWAHQPYYDLYDPASIPQPPSYADDLHDKPRYFQRLRGVWRDLTWEHVAQATACYYASISLIDAQVGRLLDVLEETGQAENTIVVYTTDHGDQMGAHGLLMKGPPPYEETYRIPLIVRWPGVVAPGTTSDALVSSMDLAPTIVEMAGCAPFETQARSLMPLLRGEPTGDVFESDFAEFHGQRFFYTQRIVWWGRHKYVLNGFDFDELYDLETDPYEMHNLAPDPAYADLAREMASRMWRRIRETDDFNMIHSHYGMFRYAPVGPGAG
jgi:choline-sulfatase